MNITSGANGPKNVDLTRLAKEASSFGNDFTETLRQEGLRNLTQVQDAVSTARPT